MDGHLILALETATGCGGAALTRGGRFGGRMLAECSLYPESGHSRRLLGVAQGLLRDCGLDFADLDAVAVSRGPGSFTGLRIGMAAGQGLAFGLGKPLAAVPTLDALAAGMPPLDMPLWALLDARKGQVYAACYDTARTAADGLPERLGPYRVCAPDRLFAEIAASGRPACCIGPGLAVCGEILEQYPEIRVAPAAVWQPRASLVGFCAADMLARGVTTEAVPLYVRSSEAELDLKRPS